MNRGKRSIVLDLNDAADAGLGGELARRADVLIENFKPGGLSRYGLGLGLGCVAANPGVVYASISGFGSGAGSGVPGYDLMVQAISGLMSLTGDPGGAAVPGGHLSVRRDGRQPCGDRHSGRSATPRCHRRGTNMLR